MFNDDLPTPKKTLFTPAVFDGLSVEVRPTLVTTVGLSKLTAGLGQLI